MKILMPVLHYYPVIGGLETWTKNIAEGMANTHKCSVFVVTGRVAGKKNMETSNNVSIVRTSFLKLKNLSFSSSFYILSSLPLIFLKSVFLVKKQKIDLIHCQGFLSSCMGYFLLKLCGVPYISTVQRQESQNFFKKIIYRDALYCIAASEAIREYFQNIGVRKIEVIPNGINLKKFENLSREASRKKLGLKDEFLIMVLARLEKVKGIEYLIEAAGLTKSRIPNVRLCILGDGSERKNLEKLSLDLRLGEVVSFLGPVPNEEAPGYLAAADCFVLPSIKEGFGIVVLEAMAAGVPVIGTNIGGIAGIITDGDNGLLIKPKDPQAIKEAVVKIYSDKDLGGKLAKSAKLGVKNYDWAAIIEGVFGIYQKAIIKKILFATGIFPPDIGGPATYVEKLATDFSKNGADVSVITYSDTEKNGNHAYSVARISRKLPKGIRHFLYYWRLFKLSARADIIYAQNPSSAGLPALFVSKIRNKKLVVKIVGDYAWEEGIRQGLINEGIDEFQNKKHGFKAEFLKLIRNFVVLGADKIITPSQYLKKIISKWGVKDGKIEVIYNAPDELMSENISKEKAKEKIGISGDIILSMGRLSPWKGFGALIDIMPELLKKNAFFRLVIVGDGEEMEILKERIKKIGLEKNVIMAGKVGHSEIPYYFKAADVFILNSEYEGLSHVILEAMQLGTPVIASNMGGNPELIQDNFNGLLAGYNKKEEIIGAVLGLWKDQEKQEKFRKNSLDKLSGFSWDNLTKQTFKALSL